MKEFVLLDTSNKVIAEASTIDELNTIAERYVKGGGRTYTAAKRVRVYKPQTIVQSVDYEAENGSA